MDIYDFETEEALLRDAYKRALLRQQTPMPEFKRHGGGVYELPGWGQIARAAIDRSRGARDEEATIAALRGLGSRRMAAQQDYLSQMPEAFENQTEELAGPPTPEGVGPGTRTVQVEKPLLQQARDWQQFGIRGMAVPGMRGIGEQALNRAAMMPQKMAENEERARLRAEELAARTEAQKEIAAQRIEAQRERDLQRAQASAASNEANLLLRQQNLNINQQRADIARAEEERKSGEARAKLDVKSQAEQTNKDMLDDLITSMQDKYAQLKDLGGISSTERGALPNAITAVGTSGLGQAAGRVFGTEEQSLRDEIKSARQQLVMAIAKRLGVTASSLNSNQELQAWLNAATDPTLGYETNVNILDDLRKRYVEGVDTAGGRITPAGGAGAAGAKGTFEKPTPVSSQAQYDALGVGEWYIPPNGNRPFQKTKRGP